MDSSLFKIKKWFKCSFHVHIFFLEWSKKQILQWEFPLKANSCEIFSENDTLSGTDFICSVWSRNRQSQYCFNEQPRQTDDPDSSTCASAGKDMRVEKDILMHHWAAEDLEDQFTFSAISDYSQHRWRAAVFGPGWVWFSQIVGCWGNTLVCLCLMGSPVFSHRSRSHPPILPKGCCSGRQQMTNLSCGGGRSLQAPLGASVLLQRHTEGKNVQVVIIWCLPHWTGWAKAIRDFRLMCLLLPKLNYGDMLFAGAVISLNSEGETNTHVTENLREASCFITWRRTLHSPSLPLPCFHHWCFIAWEWTD